MSYNPTNWQNLPSTNTPVAASNLNNIENGIATNELNINALSNYSSTEQVIGKWTNNKNVYRTVLTYTISVDNNNFGNYVGAQDLIKNIATLVSLKFFAAKNTLIVPCPNSNGDRQAGVYLQKAYGGIGLQTSTESKDFYNGASATVILEYTKTTD